MAEAHLRREGDESASDLQGLLGTLVTRALLLEAAGDLHRAGKLGPVDSLPARSSPGQVARLETRRLDAVYRVEVLDRTAEPDSVAVRAEWGRRLIRQGLSTAQVAVITLDDSVAARRLLLDTRRGRGLPDAGWTLSPARKPDVQTLHFPTTDPFWKRLQGMLAVTPPHQVHGPLKVAGGWMFLELLDRRFRGPAFDHLSAAEVTSLRSDLLEAAREQRFHSFSDSLAAAIPVTVSWDRVGRLRPVDKAPTWAVSLACVLVLALVVGLGLYYSPRPVGASMRSKAGWILVQTALIGLLFLMGARYVGRQGYGWDFENVYRSAREMRAGMSPYDPATVAKDYWDPATPFLYAPATLWVFAPFTRLPIEKATAVWMGIDVGLALVLGFLFWWILSGRLAVLLVFGMTLFGFNGALLLALRTGNVATIESLVLWVAFVALLGERRWIFACLIAVGAQFKLLPIAFLGLLAFPARERASRAGPILMGLGLFALLLALPNVLGLPWAHGYLHDLEKVRPHGEVNPSALGLIDMLLARGSEGGRGILALGLWSAYCVALLMLSADLLRRTGRSREPMEWIVVGVMLFVLLSPRPIVYGYTLAIVPALMIVQRLWPRRAAVAVVALGLQGLVLRGLFGADFIPSRLPWPVLIVPANLPFLMTLALWLAYVGARRSEPDTAPPAGAPATA